MTTPTKKGRTIEVDEDRFRDLVEKAGRAETRALNPEGEEGAGPTPQAGGGAGASLRERVASQAVLVRDYQAGGGSAHQGGEGPLSVLTPSQRVLAAHVALGIESHPNVRGNPTVARDFQAGAMARGWLSSSGKRFNTSATAGIGAELAAVCPTEEIWQSALCKSDLLAQFDPKPIKGGTMKVVNLTGMPVVYTTPIADECADLPCRSSSAVGTRTHEHAAGKLTVDLCMPMELKEDSFLDVVEEYTAIAEDAMALAQNEAIVRGDATQAGTTNINNTGAVLTLSAKDQPPGFTVFDGLAHATLVDNVANNLTAAGGYTAGDAFEPAHITAARALMRDAATKRHFGYCAPGDLLIIVDAQTYGKMLDWEDVKWVEKFGPGATLITGILPSIYGIPIVMDPGLALTDDDGTINATDPAQNIRGQLHLVNKTGFKVGIARDVEIYTEVNRACDLVHVYISWRGALARRSSSATAAGIEAVASIYGIPA